MFRFKKWLWNKVTTLKGADRAYAKYLTHFNHYQQHVSDQSLQQDLKIEAMSKGEFLTLWHKKQTKPTGKSGCCS